MPTIRKICILVSICFFSLAPAGAQTESGRYGFYLSPLFGILYGQGEEILYRDSGWDQYASQLLWDLKPLVYTGLAADFGPRDPFERRGFIAAGSIKYGLPLRTGSMEDRDWMNLETNWLTHYSQHQAYSQNAILADLSAGYSWPLTNYLALSAYGEFSFMYLSWSADNGYAQYTTEATKDEGDYPPWNNNLPKTYFNGKNILYTQIWFIFSPGLCLKGRINRLFSAQAHFNYSPLIYATAKDDHLIPNKDYQGRSFEDYLYFGHYLKGGGKFIFSPLENMDLSLSCSYRYITRTRGPSYWEYTGSEVTSHLSKNYDGGAGHSALEIEFAVRIRVKTN